LKGFGTVTAERTLELRPQVSGHITSNHPEFREGGRIPSGETLITIDPRDYEFILSAQKASFAEAKAALQLEQGNQIVAEKEWSLLGSSIEASDQQKNLALRKPQLAAKQAALTAAESMVKKAELDLSRTTITAPFDSLVLSPAIAPQQFVSPQASIGKVVATDRFLIKVKIAADKLELLSPTSTVEASVTPQENSAVSIPGVFLGAVGTVDVEGGTPEVSVAVNDPLGKVSGLPQLLLGSYVAVEFQGQELQQVLEIPRSAARENNELWLLTKDSKLARITYSPAFSDEHSIFVTASYPKDSRLITSNLSLPLEGMQLIDQSQSDAAVGSPQ
jgi:RND family efflux transporter MFP subunit